MQLMVPEDIFKIVDKLLHVNLRIIHSCCKNQIYKCYKRNMTK